MVPNFLITGVLAMVLAASVLVWAAAFVHRKHGGTILLLLTVVLFLVGGGFTTLWFGILAGLRGPRSKRRWRGGERTFLPACRGCWLFCGPGS
jgi:hypothetical protein